MENAVDFAAHNAEVAQVWEAYHRRQPIRVPVILGINPRYTMFRHPANPRGIQFADYLRDPQLMLERQCEHEYWIRHHVPQDAPMGLPADGWHIHVDFQNTYEAVWFGCPWILRDGQVPDAAPLLADDTKKNLLFERGIPDPFTGGEMARNWEFYAYFKRKQEEGFTWKDRPIAAVSPTGLGTDGPMTIACCLRGATEFCTDLLADTGYALQLLEYITEATIQRIQAYRKHLGMPLKTQSWGFADDSIQLLSTGMYRELILPFHRRLVETFAESGPNGIHLCGDATRHFPLIREELKVDSFDTGYPVDFAWLRRTLGPDVQIQGGPTVMLLQHGSPAAVDAEVRRICESGILAGGRFILRDANNVPPGVPLENLQALYQAAKQYGRYPAS
ncbi:MAG TPA: uroporphyrinogen decarboxylase family protein [Armatimonadota bacterium]|nr:uroporphyrinogen decarboxylase family protein [Armatimonadota bacterium]